MSCQNWKTSPTNAGRRPCTSATLELQRLDDLYLIAYRAIIGGNSLAGIDRCLRIMERRSKLLGLDAAEKVEHSGDLVINLRSVDMGVPDE